MTELDQQIIRQAVEVLRLCPGRNKSLSFTVDAMVMDCQLATGLYMMHTRIPLAELDKTEDPDGLVAAHFAKLIHGLKQQMETPTNAPTGRPTQAQRRARTRSPRRRR